MILLKLLELTREKLLLYVGVWVVRVIQDDMKINGIEVPRSRFSEAQAHEQYYRIVSAAMVRIKHWLIAFLLFDPVPTTPECLDEGRTSLFSLSSIPPSLSHHCIFQSLHLRTYFSIHIMSLQLGWICTVLLL